MFFFDPLYLVFMIPGLLLALWASFITKSTFNKYSQIGTITGVTGAEAAQRMLNYAGIDDVSIEPISGFLSDHYDPSSKVLRLSPDVYSGASLSAIGVACHEAGHAMQHAEAYAPLAIRSLMVPITNISSTLSYPLLFLGFIFQSQSFVLLGIILFSCAVLFSIITLPVEWNASSRAKQVMVQANIVSDQESYDAGKVLNAAFMTYVASAVSALLTLLYYLLRSGLLGSDD